MFIAGSHLGPYEILAPFDAGGMGKVYRARDIRLDGTVPIKFCQRRAFPLCALLFARLEDEPTK